MYARVFTDYTRGKLNNDEDLPRIPQPRVGAELDTDYGQWGFGTNIVHHADQEKTAAFESRADAYTTVGFNVDYYIESAQLDWVLFLRGDNVTDEKGRRHQSRLKELVPIRGRALTVGLRGTW